MDRIIHNAANAAGLPLPIDSATVRISKQIVDSIEHGISIAEKDDPPQNDIYKFLEDLQRRADLA